MLYRYGEEQAGTLHCVQSPVDSTSTSTTTCTLNCTLQGTTQSTLHWALTKYILLCTPLYFSMAPKKSSLQHRTSKASLFSNNNSQYWYNMLPRLQQKVFPNAMTTLGGQDGLPDLLQGHPMSFPPHTGEMVTWPLTDQLCLCLCLCLLWHLLIYLYLILKYYKTGVHWAWGLCYLLRLV